jgi:hypothetical protein
MSLTPRTDRIERAIFGSTINTSRIAAPFTQIVNEYGQARQIPDPENNMKVSGGTERIDISSISLLDNEFGPGGEQVYEIQSKDSRIRLVGGWDMGAGTNGVSAVNTSKIVTDFIEITFFGTGINLLNYQDVNTGDWRVTVDGGSESANLYVAAIADPLNSRNYNKNTIHPAVSGLSLGVHTVKIRQGSAVVVNPMVVFGLEILDESTQLTVNAGQPMSGDLDRVLTQQNLPFKPAAMTGTKGGFVQVVQNADGVVSQKFTETDVSQLNLGAADHSNEQILKRIFWRDFGANRGDDFDTLSAGPLAAFTLDDGTTTLVGNAVRADLGPTDEILRCNSVSTAEFLTITFMGTGLDILRRDEPSSEVVGTGPEVFINGASEGNLSGTFNRTVRRESVVSGLPYGTHTVKISNSATARFGVIDFIIYGPKEPTLLDEDIVLAEYNVMADYVANAVPGLETISTGVLRKSATRENTYINTWTLGPIAPVSYIGGWTVSTAVNGGYVECTFFGTGFDLRGLGFTSASTNVSVDIDGLLATTANFPGLVSSFYGYTSFAAGILNPDTGVQALGSGLSISGLPLGVHTVRFTNNTAIQFQFETIDIITPIHINDSSFKVGNLGLADKRKDVQTQEELESQVDLSKAKAWIKFDGVGNTILSSYNISAVIDISAGHFDIHFKNAFKDKEYVIAGAGRASTMFTGNFSSDNITKEKARIIIYNDAGGPTDAAFTAVFFGELENEEDL